jgi:hypothetical protein
VDAALTDFSVAVSFQNADQFVARRAFPVASSPTQSNRYHIYTSADLLRTDAEAYAGKGPTAGRDFRLSNTPFWIEVWGVHYDVGRHERANADRGIDLEEDAAAVLMQDLMIREEVAFVTAAMTSGVWGTTVTGATNFTRWDDASSTPIENVTTGDVTVLGNTGRRPNKLVVGYSAWANGLRNHPDLLDRIKYSVTGVVTESLVAAVLGLDEVLVASAARNTAEEGLAATGAMIVGDDALLIHTSGGGVRTPTAGRTFTWSAYGPDGIATERFDIPEQGAFPRVQSFRTFDHAVTASALGYFFDDCIT